jgi:hypothetical protein
VNALHAVSYGASSITEAETVVMLETHTDRFIIRFENSTSRNWSLFDLNGRSVSSGSSNTDLNIGKSNLAKGVYALQIEEAGKLNMIKLVIP